MQRLFSGETPSVASVLAGPTAPGSRGFAQALAAELARHEKRVWLAAANVDRISQTLGYRPLLSWRTSLPLVQQVIEAGAYGVIPVPGMLSGEAALVDAVMESRGCDCLLFDDRSFTVNEAPVVPGTAQTLIILLGKYDAEAGYALIKGLALVHSPARILLLGEKAELLAEAARQFLAMDVEHRQMAADVCQIDNRKAETSSNTLSVDPNLTWVVSRIMQNDQPKVANGGCSKRAEEVYK